MYIEQLKKMFAEMVVPKKVDLIPVFYHPELLLYTNEQVTNYQAFYDSHVKYYASEITYQVQQICFGLAN